MNINQTKFSYPALMNYEEDNSKNVEVEFPDFTWGATYGENLLYARKYAKELLELLVIASIEDQDKELPEPTPIKDVKIEPGQFVEMINIDLSSYFKRMSKAVRKNITIPEYLVQQVKNSGENLSTAIRNALEEKYM